MSKVQISVMCILSVAGGAAANALGGWSDDLITLFIFMGLDFITGLIIAFFMKSKKTGTGSLSSSECFKGLVKKCVMITFVLIANRLDISLNTGYIRTAVIIGFLVNELISIVENAGILGVPLPKIVINAIDLLKNKSEPE